jgi:signal peptidase I
MVPGVGGRAPRLSAKPYAAPVRRAVAGWVLLSVAVFAAVSCSGSSGRSAAAVAVGKLRPTKTKACADAGEAVVDYLVGSSDDAPHFGNLKVVRANLRNTPKRDRNDSIRAHANAAIIVCDQQQRGVAWSTTEPLVFSIPSDNMKPDLKIGDHVIVNKAAYEHGDPKRGDIVVFDAPPAARTANIQYLVKRIVGMPGETIEGRAGRIYIDGQLLDEPYLSPRVKSRVFGPDVIPRGAYFMLGDNRQYSKDSTFFGPIKRSALVGPVTKI